MTKNSKIILDDDAQGRESFNKIYFDNRKQEQFLQIKQYKKEIMIELIWTLALITAAVISMITIVSLISHH